jgi:hypothetical protein
MNNVLTPLNSSIQSRSMAPHVGTMNKNGRTVFVIFTGEKPVLSFPTWEAAHEALKELQL